MLYDMLKISVSVFFNLFNKLVGNRLPPFGSACVVVEKDGRYLVVELPHKRFVFPGGFMNWRELPHQTAEREGYEETGLRLRTVELLSTHCCPSTKITQLSTISFIYRAEVIGGELRKNAEGRPHWLSESELRQRMGTSGLRTLDEYLSKTQPPAAPSESSASAVRP